MKILYYSPHPMINTAHQAGYATHINEMINAFVELGHEVKPLIMGGTENEDTQTRESESKLKKLAKKLIPAIIWETLKDIQLLWFDKYAERILDEALTKFQPDLIYERANYLQLSGIRLAKKYGIKHVLEINSPYVEERIDLQGKSFLIKKAKNIEKKQLKKTNLRVVVSSALMKYFSEKYKIKKDNFLITPNAVNLNKVITDINKIRALQNKYKSNNKLIIGFIGSFFHWHGINMLIKAFSALARNNPNIKLLIIGSGEIETELKMLANRLCPEKIIFTGKIIHDNIFNYISLFDIAVSPNAGWYQSPIKVFEYGIMKKAIIAPDFAPLQDVINNNTDAILIQPSVENIKNAIQKLISNKELRNKLSENFYNKIINNYTWKKNAEKILNSVDQIKNPL